MIHAFRIPAASSPSRSRTARRGRRPKSARAQRNSTSTASVLRASTDPASPKSAMPAKVHLGAGLQIRDLGSTTGQQTRATRIDYGSVSARVGRTEDTAECVGQTGGGLLTAAGFGGALTTELPETPSEMVGGDEDGDSGGGEIGAVAIGLAADDLFLERAGNRSTTPLVSGSPTNAKLGVKPRKRLGRGEFPAALEGKTSSRRRPELAAWRSARCAQPPHCRARAATGGMARARAARSGAGVADPRGGDPAQLWLDEADRRIAH